MYLLTLFLPGMKIATAAAKLALAGARIDLSAAYGAVAFLILGFGAQYASPLRLDNVFLSFHLTTRVFCPTGQGI